MLLQEFFASAIPHRVYKTFFTKQYSTWNVLPEIQLYLWLIFLFKLNFSSTYCSFTVLRVISHQEQINGQLVVILHQNIPKIASLRFLKLNLEYQNIKMGKKTYEHLFFFFHEFMFWITIMQWYTKAVSIAAVFVKKSAILSQKKLH